MTLLALLRSAAQGDVQRTAPKLENRSYAALLDNALEQIDYVNHTSVFA